MPNVYNSSGNLTGFYDNNTGIFTPVSGSSAPVQSTPQVSVPPPPQISPGTVTSPTAATISGGVSDLAAKIAALQQRIATEGVTSSTGQVLLAPTISSIDTTNIKSAPEIPYVSPTTTPTYNVAGLTTTPALTKTPEEQKAQTLTEQLQALNLSLVGESAYRTQQEATQDITGLTKTKQDLTNQLNILANEAAAIPLQLQQEATGRGITTAVLQRQENDRLRTNSIAALGVSAMLQAANGNLATANSLIDRAVAAKFDPIREEINAKINNLNLIIKSPDYTLAEYNRAQAQLDIQNANKAALAQAQTEAEDIYKIAVEAASQGVDAVTLQRILNAKSVIEATQIAQQAGLFKPADEILSVAEAKALNVPYGTTKTQAAAMGITPAGEPTVTETKQATQSKIITDAMNELDAQRSKSQDGFSNPDTYRKAKTAYINAGGTPADFFQALPVEVYIAPVNRKGDLAIYKTTTGTAGGGISNEDLVE